MLLVEIEVRLFCTSGTVVVPVSALDAVFIIVVVIIVVVAVAVAFVVVVVVASFKS